jgi:hypothetical protein
MISVSLSTSMTGWAGEMHGALIVPVLQGKEHGMCVRLCMCDCGVYTSMRGWIRAEHRVLMAPVLQSEEQGGGWEIESE